MFLGGFRSAVARRVRSQTGTGLAVTKGGVFLPNLVVGRSLIVSLLLGFFALASAQAAPAATGIDTAIADFRTEALRLIGSISTVGVVVIGAGVLMALGWAMLRKVGSAK